MRSALFVDDHPISRDAARRALELEIEGLRVATAENSGAAPALLAGREVDLCLGDDRLPDGDSLSLRRGVLLLRKPVQPLRLSALLGSMAAE
ncbi:response regulator [Bradyrhizobium sp. USDA 4353]